MHSALLNIEEWLTLTAAEQDRIIVDISDNFEEFLIHKGTRSYSDNPSFRIPTYCDTETGIELSLIIGGEFRMGLSDEEIKIARTISPEIEDICETMTPVRTITISPFLISRLPILVPIYDQFFPSKSVDLRMSYSSNRTNLVPKFMYRDELDEMATQLGYTIPSEAQIEYAYRGNTTSLFYFGNSLPEQFFFQQILIHEFDDENTYMRSANQFGLAGLCTGDWCADAFEPYCASTGSDDLPVSGGSPYVIRGGASAYWPWADSSEGWVACMSAFRTASTEAIDGAWPGRFALRLEALFDN